MRPDLSELDRVNQRAWSSEPLTREFQAMGSLDHVNGWTDPGEQAALSHVASAVRGRPILDVGVGGGRTTTLLRLLSDDYIAIDYTPEMVAACRQNHPGVDVRLADARDLSDFADGAFGLVVFSNNGLDALEHEGRRRALAEMARVLADDGVLLYSTHNKNGPCYRATPLRRAGSPLAHTWSPAFRMSMALKAVLMLPVQLPRAIRNRRRLAPSTVEHEQWSIAALEAHDFSLLIHYSSIVGVREELRQADLNFDAAFDAEHGRVLSAGADLSEVRYFQIVARKYVPAAEKAANVS